MSNIKNVFGRQLDIGPFVVLFVIVNGMIALASALLRSRIYDDDIIYLILVVVLINMSMAAWLIWKAPKINQHKSSDKKNGAGAKHGAKAGKNNKKKRK